MKKNVKKCINNARKCKKITIMKVSSLKPWTVDTHPLLSKKRVVVKSLVKES